MLVKPKRAYLREGVPMLLRTVRYMLDRLSMANQTEPECEHIQMVLNMLGNSKMGSPTVREFGIMKVATLT